MANAKDWTLAGLDTMALFEYMRNGHKHEDLSVRAAAPTKPR